MKKIPTYFEKDKNDLSRVINEISSGNYWVITEGIATRKFDGTASAIINGELYKRYDVKKGKSVPENAIPCQDPDEFTGHWPHWVKCDRNKIEDKYFFEGYDNSIDRQDGTFELCGPKVQGNPEKLDRHILIRHGSVAIEAPTDYWGIKEYFEKEDIEGIVFHHPDGRMCKIRKKDFGIKR